MSLKGDSSDVLDKGVKTADLGLPLLLWADREADLEFHETSAHPGGPVVSAVDSAPTSGRDLCSSQDIK